MYFYSHRFLAVGALWFLMRLLRSLKVVEVAYLRNCKKGKFCFSIDFLSLLQSWIFFFYFLVPEFQTTILFYFWLICFFYSNTGSYDSWTFFFLFSLNRNFCIKRKMLFFSHSAPFVTLKKTRRQKVFFFKLRHQKQHYLIIPLKNKVTY